jgi:histidinol-phosphate aminotransferase
MIRPDLATVERYRWQEGWEQQIPPGTPVIRLDQNTQPRPPSWYAGAAAWLAQIPVNAYPDSRYSGLRQAIAEYVGFPAEQVVVTAGADEALMLCALLTLSPGDRAYARAPHYAVYRNVTRLAGGVLGDEPAGARLTWVCSPHNPTGEDAPGDVPAPADGLVVIDQAYLEFGGSDLSQLVRERDDVVVVRTLSKAFALAGARVGYVIAPPALADTLEAIRPPGSISSFSVAVALRASGSEPAWSSWAGASPSRAATRCSPTSAGRHSRRWRGCLRPGSWCAASTRCPPACGSRSAPASTTIWCCGRWGWT